MTIADRIALAVERARQAHPEDPAKQLLRLQLELSVIMEEK